MPVKQSYAGRTFGQITLDAPVENRPGYWKGRCSCGNPVEKRIDNLKRPGNHTCGRCTPSPRPPEPETAVRLATLETEVAALREELAVWKAHGPAIPLPESTEFPG
jgi:hypothetical protein